ncbi:hypothetical protein N9I38_04045 [Gammaproteobacteria bacterium]|nr:hypothetical protein [Gammaproteobacteria bacterium]
MPGVAIVTSSVPLVALLPVQVPEAVQLVALVEDQVRVTAVSRITELEDEDKDDVGLGSGAGVPPPPPPPQETTKIKIIKECAKGLIKFKRIILPQIKNL